MEASVVTAERFAKGYTYKDYLDAIKDNPESKANVERFELNDKEFKLKDEDTKFFAAQG